MSNKEQYRPTLYTISEYCRETGKKRHEVKRMMARGEIGVVRSVDKRKLVGVLPAGGKYPRVVTQAELARRAKTVSQAIKATINLNPGRFNLVVSYGGRIVGIEDDKKVKRFMGRGGKGRVKIDWTKID